MTCDSSERRVSRRGLAALAVFAWPSVGLVLSGHAQPAVSSAPRPLPAELVAAIQRRNTELAATWLSGDVDRRMSCYAPDSVSNPDYQPRLYGRSAIARYYRFLASRQRVSGYTRNTTELLPLGDDNVLESGGFEITRQPRAGGASQPYRGRYINLWRRQPDGALRLKAEVWGYRQRIDDPASHSLGEPQTPGQAAPSADPVIEAELARQNRLDAEAVRNHDTAAKVAKYAADAIYMPFADTPKIGIDEIRTHLTAYTDQGRGVTFESVRVWNEGFEALDGYVIEYPKFEVRWRNGADFGVVSGGGLRLWRREADGSLKLLRQIATHDHRA